MKVSGECITERRVLHREAADAASRYNGWLHFRRSFAVAFTNPKVIMFFMAFRPFVMRANAPPIALMPMMVHVSLICLLHKIGLVPVGNAVARLLSGVKAARIITQRAAGGALNGFGIKLALDECRGGCRQLAVTLICNDVLKHRVTSTGDKCA